MHHITLYFTVPFSNSLFFHSHFQPLLALLYLPIYALTKIYICTITISLVNSITGELRSLMRYPNLLPFTYTLFTLIQLKIQP